MQGRQKVEKLRNAVFCQCFVVLEKSRLAKAASAEPSGEIRYQKLHAVAAPSRFPNIKWKCKKRAGPEHFLEVEMLKKRMLLCCETHFEVNILKTLQFQNTFGSWTAPHYTTTAPATAAATTTSTTLTATTTATTTTTTTKTTTSTTTTTTTITTTTTTTNKEKEREREKEKEK